MLICKKCGMEASSKCPSCRSVFPVGADMLVETIEMCTRFRVQRGGDRDPNAPTEALDLATTIERGDSIIIKRMYNDPEKSAFEMLQRTVRILARADEAGLLNQAVCVHEWAWVGDAKSSIGCGCSVPRVTEKYAAKLRESKGLPPLGSRGEE